MNQVLDRNCLVKRFNNDEAVWQSYVRKRESRKRLCANSPLPQTILDQLDWQDAERDGRITWCVSNTDSLLVGE